MIDNSNIETLMNLLYKKNIYFFFFFKFFKQIKKKNIIKLIIYNKFGRYFSKFQNTIKGVKTNVRL